MTFFSFVEVFLAGDALKMIRKIKDRYLARWIMVLVALVCWVHMDSLKMLVQRILVRRWQNLASIVLIILRINILYS